MSPSTAGDDWPFGSVQHRTSVCLAETLVEDSNSVWPFSTLRGPLPGILRSLAGGSCREHRTCRHQVITCVPNRSATSASASSYHCAGVQSPASNPVGWPAANPAPVLSCLPSRDGIGNLVMASSTLLGHLHAAIRTRLVGGRSAGAGGRSAGSRGCSCSPKRRFPWDRDSSRPVRRGIARRGNGAVAGPDRARTYGDRYHCRQERSSRFGAAFRRVA